MRERAVIDGGPGIGRLNWRHGLFARVLLAGVVLGGLVVGMAVTLGLASRASQRSASAVAHSDQVLAASFLIERGLVDVETGVRAFAATGARLFLEPADQARATLPGELESLRRLVSDTPVQQRGANGLTASVDSYLDVYALPLTERTVALDRRELIVSFARGKRWFDLLRAGFDHFNTVEEALRAARTRQAAGTAATVALVRLVTTGATLLALVGLLIYVLRMVVSPLRRAIAACARVANGERNELLKVSDRTELGELARAFNSMVGRLAAGDAELRESERRRREIVESSRDQALEASRLKSEFLANMSHEIRTPLNGVLGMTSLLLDSELAPDQRGLAETVRVSGEVLLALLNDILDFSKIEAGHLDLESIDFDLRSLVEDVADLLSLPAHSKGLELACRLPVQMPAMVQGDPNRVRQIVTNLVGNAIKFTTTGEVLIDLRIEERDEQSTTFRLEVTDTGIGIAHVDQIDLFESFSQVDTSTTRRFGGTGLGLAISRQLVELMGGQIGVRSQPGRGSTFWFTVAFERAQVKVASVAAPAELAGLRMLVVDDNATNRAILTRFLNAWGIRCDAAASALQAQQAVAASVTGRDPFDILLLDLNMPGTDGIELATSIIADPSLGSPRMILLTSSMLKGEASAAREAGIAACLTKPVRQSLLRGCLISLMAEPGPAPAPTAAPGSHAPAPTAGRVLLAEDNEINQIVAQTMLAKLGYEVDVVTNGAQAVNAATHTSYQVILMDCQMPVLDGYGATAQIRHLQQGSRRTPIIALTASALKTDRQRCLDAGMDDHVAKPMSLQTMGAVLHRWTPTKPAAIAITP